MHNLNSEKLWENNISNSFSVTESNPEIDYITFKDASTKCWVTHDNTQTIKRRWLDCEFQSHINVIDLTVSLPLALSSLCNKT